MDEKKDEVGCLAWTVGIVLAVLMLLILDIHDRVKRLEEGAPEANRPRLEEVSR